MSNLLGYALQKDEHYYIASEWMEKRDLQSRMAEYSMRELFGMVFAFYLTARYSNLPFQSLGIAKGLHYLHNLKVAHGDIKTVGLKSPYVIACLMTEFLSPMYLYHLLANRCLQTSGLSRMAELVYSKGYYSTVTVRSSHRWVPYEYYHVEDDEIFRPNLKSDVWAFGMTLLVRTI